MKLEAMKQLLLSGETYIGKRRNAKYNDQYTYTLIDKDGTELVRTVGTVKEVKKYCD